MFKIGDRVKLANDIYFSYYCRGKIGTITRISPISKQLTIEVKGKDNLRHQWCDKEMYHLLKKISQMEIE